MDNLPILTIVIPTYNRNEKLARSVAILVPQLTAQVKLLIIDNCSAIPVRDSLQYLLQSNIRIIRNKTNVGLAANIIRCFESCDTDWMWLLGDDDVPNNDSVENILQEIIKNSDCVYLNYSSPLVNREKYFYTTGQDELINKLDNFGNLLFISVGVYNLKNLKGDLRLAYHLSYSIAPHIVYLLTGVKLDGRVAFIDKEIHDFKLYDTKQDESWSWLSLSMCIPVLYELPLNVSQQTKNKFSEQITTHIKSPKFIYGLLQRHENKGMSLSHKRFLLRQIYYRSLLVNGFTSKIVQFIYYDIKLMLNGLLFRSSKVEAISNHDDRI